MDGDRTWWNMLTRRSMQIDRAGDRLAERGHARAFRRIMLAGAIAAALGIPIGMAVGAGAGITVAVCALIGAWFIYNRAEKSIDDRVDELVNSHKTRSDADN